MLHSRFVNRYRKNNWCHDLYPVLLFLLKLDESTDMSGLAVLLAFVRYLFKNRKEEDFLSDSAVVKLLLFHTTYLRKAGFSRYVAMVKTSLHTRCRHPT